MAAMKMIDLDSEYSKAPKEQFELETANDHECKAEITFDTGSKERFTRPKPGLEGIRTRGYWTDLFRALFCETFISLLFVYVTILICQMGNGLAIALGVGALVFALVATFVTISGSMFNPIVAIGFFLVGEISLLRASLYVVVECLGSIAGAFIARAVLSSSVVEVAGEGNFTQFELINGGAHFLHGGITPGLAILAEMLYALVLLAVIFNGALDAKSGTPMGPIAIGLVVTALVMAGMENTSGSFNPARSLGAAVAISYYRPDVWEHHYVYWVGPILGSILAAFIYRCFFADEKHSIRTRALKLI